MRRDFGTLEREWVSFAWRRVWIFKSRQCPTLPTLILPPGTQAFLMFCFTPSGVVHGIKSIQWKWWRMVPMLCPGHLCLVLLVHCVWRSQLLCCEETHKQPGGEPYHEELRHLLQASTCQPAEWAILRLVSSSHRHVSSWGLTWDPKPESLMKATAQLCEMLNIHDPTV